MRVLIDCDVLLDVALRREPYFEYSSQILDWAESHPGKAAVAWHSIANIIYLCKGNSKQFVSELIEFIEIPEAGTDAMRFALELGMKDVEDAMQVAVADCFNAQVIATRNIKDYAKSPIKAMKPDALVALLQH